MEVLEIVTNIKLFRLMLYQLIRDFSSEKSHYELRTCQTHADFSVAIADINVNQSNLEFGILLFLISE